MDGAPGQKLALRLGSALEDAAAQKDGMPEQKLSLRLGSALEDAIAQKTGIFGGLLTRPAAVRLLCQENGISTEEKILLSGARSALLSFSFVARVDRVFPIQHFPGGSMRSIRLHISDKSGEATLVLWNEQAKLAEGVLAGDEIECKGAYSRSGEIAIMGKGSFARIGGRKATGVEGLREGACNVEGIVEKAEGARKYRDRKTGEEKAMFSFSLCSNGKCCRAILWSAQEGQSLPRDGESVVLENATFRNGEIHLNSFSRIVARESKDAQSGEFRGISFEGESVAVELGQEKFLASLAEALSLFNVISLPGVPPQELLMIKARALEGKKAVYSVKGSHLAYLKFEG